MVVLLLLAARFGAQALAGSALVRSAPDDAVGRAVLDALNRQLAAQPRFGAPGRVWDDGPSTTKDHA